MFSKKNRHLFSILFSALVLVILGIYIYYSRETLVVLFDASLTEAVLIALLIAAAAIGRGAINYFFYRQLDVALPFSEAIGLAILNTIGNLLPLSGGLVAKGLYLRKKYRLEFSRYFSSTLSLFICFISVNGITGLVSLHFMAHRSGKEISATLMAAFLLMALGIAVIWVPVKSGLFPERFQSFAVSVREGWSVLSRKKGLLLLMIFFQLASLTLIALRLGLVFGLFSIRIDFLACLLFAAVTVLTSLVNIVPGGIGIREAIIGSSSYLIGYPFGLSIVAVALDRACVVAATGVMAIIYYYLFGTRLLPDKKPDKPETERGENHAGNSENNE